MGLLTGVGWLAGTAKYSQGECWPYWKVRLDVSSVTSEFTDLCDFLPVVFVTWHAKVHIIDIFQTVTN